MEHKPTYTLHLSSNDRISGSDNNAVFNINWASFLPSQYDKFKVRYSFLITAGLYVDTAESNFCSCQIVVNFQGQSLSYSTTNDSATLILGYAQREYPSTYNCFASHLLDYPPKTISKPTQNILNVQIYNPNLQNSFITSC
jgi:hypothetical protein